MALKCHASARLTGERLVDDDVLVVVEEEEEFISSSFSSSSSLSSFVCKLIMSSLFIALNVSLKCISNKRLCICVYIYERQLRGLELLGWLGYRVQGTCVNVRVL